MMHPSSSHSSLALRTLTDTAEPREEVPCPLCGARQHRLVLHACDRLFAQPGTYRVVACSACEMRYLSPRPTLSALAAHYPSHYFIYQTPDALPSLTRPLLRSFALQRWKKSLARLEKVTGRLRPEQRVVDVGCGQNDYLVALRTLRGITGVGVDFKREVADYVRDQLHMPVHAGTLHDAAFPTHSVDLVTMNEYLEHEPEPLNVLREAHRITRPSGYLALEVPYVESLPARIFGSSWSQVDAPRHLVHFTRETLAEMLRRSGYELVHTETFQIPFVIGLSVLHALGHKRLGRLTLTDRNLILLAALPLLVLSPWLHEFRFAVARAL